MSWTVRAAAIGILILGLTAFSARAAEGHCELELRLEAPLAAKVHEVEYFFFTATVENRGAEPVTLVDAGDGSADGWRTPLIKWRVEGVEPPDFPSQRTCGNLSALQPEELFVLAPGESRQLGPGIRFPDLREPGTYRVNLEYENRPWIEWLGIPLGDHHAETLERIRSSTHCLARSNTVELELR